MGDSTVMISCEVDGRAVWIVDDYLNRARHIIFQCNPDRFLHLSLDVSGAASVTEKTREHATLRIIRRDERGALISDEAIVQEGENIESLARRCGCTRTHIAALNPSAATAFPPRGALLRLA